MKHFHLNHVARYQAKILRRSPLYVISTTLLFLIVLSIQVFMQSEWGVQGSLLAHGIPSFFPLTLAWMFNQCQVIPLVLIVSLYFSNKKTDSREVIFSRPESNAGYILGTVGGVVCEFLILAGCVFLIGGVLQKLATPLPLNVWHYLFYLLTLVFPTLLYVFALTCWLNNLLRNFAFTLLLLIGSYVFLQVFLLTPLYGVFDPLGTRLPAAFSQVTGLVGLPAYLCHRLGWLAVGLGLLRLFVAGFARIPNRSRARRRHLLVGGLWCAAGCLLLAGYVGIERKKDANGEKAIAAYIRYAGHARLAMAEQEISYYQPGNRMEVSARVTLKNEHATPVDGIVLYLNPGLSVSGISCEGKPLPFERDHQVIRIAGSVGGGEECRLDIRYAGTIDESICYLDVKNRREQDLEERADFVARYGSRYAFLDKKYTLLTPECLWYPVAVPPVNPRSVYSVERQFTHYHLTVSAPGSRCVISQGARNETEDAVIFRSGCPLTGITLVMGDYICRRAEADGIGYELYTFPHSEPLLKEWELLRDTIEPVLSAAMKKLESEKAREYPFDRLVVAETPLTFTTYDRPQKGGDDRQQPGIMLLPEKGYGMSVWNFYATARYRQQELMGPTERSAARFSGRFWYVFNMDTYSTLSPGQRFLSRQTGYMDSRTLVRNNPYDLSRTLYYHTNALNSPDYPVLDVVLSSFMIYTTQKESSMTAVSSTTQSAVAYLAEHSFGEGMEDGTLFSAIKQEMVNLKSKELRDCFSVAGVSGPDFSDFIRAAFDKAMFRTLSFDTLNYNFQERFGVDWRLLLDNWYTTRNLPAYVVKDVSVAAINSGSPISSLLPASFRISFSAYNAGKADGVLTLNLSADVVSSVSPEGYAIAEEKTVSYPFLIRAGEARQVAFIHEGLWPDAWINTNISLNEPVRCRYLLKTGVTQDTSVYNRAVDVDCFLSPPGEWLVDNEDAGCKIQHAPSSRRLVEWFAGKSGDRSYYRSLLQAKASPESWVSFVDQRVYGSYVFSTYGKKAARGKAVVTWETELDKAGTYEVYASLPKVARDLLSSRLEAEKRKTAAIAGHVMLEPGDVGAFNYYYTVVHNGEESEITVDYSPLVVRGQMQLLPLSEDRNWISLGRFRLEKGKQAVRLSDRGDGDYMIQADAVKWVLLSEP